MYIHTHTLHLHTHTLPQVANYHVSATTACGALTLLYQVLPGACDRSFGIHCAQLAHFPKEVVEAAKRKLQELEDDFEDKEEGGEAKRRRVRREGEEQVRQCLQSLTDELGDVTSLTDEEVEKALVAAKEVVLKQDNAYVRHLLRV